MNNRTINEITLQQLLWPMMRILDEKNIIEGIKSIIDNAKLYICFDKEYLSCTNKLILEKISTVYSETFFYSDNEQSPKLDRLEYWCPDRYYDKEFNIIERIHNKKMIVLELDVNNAFVILGTTIMLANVLQEQDPMQLKSNEKAQVLTTDIIDRHQHYMDFGCQDSNWIHLNVSLNKDNPLRENFYAPLMCICEINSPIQCDNMVATTMIGYDEKKYINFNMKKEELEKVIREHFQKNCETEEQTKKDILNEIQRNLIKNND